MKFKTSNGTTGRWTALLVGTCAVQFVLLIVLAGMWKGNYQPVPAREARSYSAMNSEPFFLGRPGPWGELEYARINIEPPDEFIQVDGQHVFAKTAWFFPNYSRAQLTAFFNSCDLQAEQRDELLNPASWADETNGIVVTPSKKVILGLDPKARARIYSTLAESTRNSFQCYPYTYRTTGFDDWFGNSGLSETTLGWLKRLVYQRGHSLCFSDVPELFDQIPTLAEQGQLVKTLLRNSTLLMRLHIEPDTDVAGLTAYWSKGKRAKDIRPLLESLTKVKGGISVDVSQVLPPFARKHLNTYTSPETYAGKAVPDCYWSSMNFFNDPPDDRFFDEAYRVRFISDNYTPVTEPTFGDLVLLLRPDNITIHAAIYIADDVVFTKNGANYRQPWVFMKTDDLLSRYPENYSIRLVFLRSKELAN